MDSDSDYTDEETEEECPDCGETFSDMNKLVTHFDTVHQKNKSTKVVHTETNSGIETSSSSSDSKKQTEIKSDKVLPPSQPNTKIKNEAPSIQSKREATSSTQSKSEAPSIQSKREAPSTKSKREAPSTQSKSEAPLTQSKSEPSTTQSKSEATSSTQSKRDVTPSINKEKDSESEATFEDLLARYLQENNLPFMPRFSNTSGGNSWYEAVSDQILLHNIPKVPRDHASLRKALCDALLTLPQAKAWVKNLFGGKKKKYLGFVEKHRKDGESPDPKGLICQATALYLKRIVHIVGTANMNQSVCYTKLESVPEAEKMLPINIGYFQDNYQSLEKMHVDASVKEVGKDKVNRVDDNKIVGKAPRVPIASKPLRRKKTVPTNVDSTEIHDNLTTKLNNGVKDIPPPGENNENIKNKIDKILETAVQRPVAAKPPAKSGSNNVQKMKENSSLSTISPQNNSGTNNVQKMRTKQSMSSVNSQNNIVPNNVQMKENPIGPHNAQQMKAKPSMSSVTSHNSIGQNNVLMKAKQSLSTITTQNNAGPNNVQQTRTKPSLSPIPPQNNVQQLKAKQSLSSLTLQNNAQQIKSKPSLSAITPQNKIGQNNVQQMKANSNLSSITTQNNAGTNNVQQTKPSGNSKNNPGPNKVQQMKAQNNSSLNNVQPNKAILGKIPRNPNPTQPLRKPKPEATEGKLNQSKDVIQTKNVGQNKNVSIRKETTVNKAQLVKNMAQEKNIEPSKIKLQKVKQMSVMNRRKYINNAAIKIQKWFRHVHRGKVDRRNFLRKKQAAIKIQSLWRSYVARKKQAAMIKKRLNNSAGKIQRWFRHIQRGLVDRRNFLQKRQAAIKIQSLWTSFFSRRKAIKTKAAITLQTKLRSVSLRKKFLKKKESATKIQKFFRNAKKGTIYRKAFLRKRQAAITLQSHCRNWLAACKAPTFHLLPPNEHCINPETGDLQSVGEYRIDPETGEMEKVPIALEEYVNRLNKFLDFTMLSKMSTKSWKKSEIKKADKDRLQSQMPRFKDLSTISSDIENKNVQNEVCDQLVMNKVEISMKPSKNFEIIGEQSSKVKWKKPKTKTPVYSGVLAETSHWKFAFKSKTIDNNMEVNDGDYDDYDHDFGDDHSELGFNFASISNLENPFEQTYNSRFVAEHVIDLILETIIPSSSYSGNQFNNWQTHKSQQEKPSWLERNIETKRDLVKSKAAVTIQSYWRSYHNRKQFNKTKDSAIKIQKWIRHIINGRKSRNHYIAQKNAALTFQSHWRGMIERRMFGKVKIANGIVNDLLNDVATKQRAAVTLQSCWRGKVVRKNYQKFKIANSVMNDLLDGAVAPRNASQDILDNILNSIFPNVEIEADKPVEEKAENSKSLLEEFLRMFPEKAPKKLKKNIKLESRAKNIVAPKKRTYEAVQDNKTEAIVSNKRGRNARSDSTLKAIPLVKTSNIEKDPLEDNSPIKKEIIETKSIEEVSITRVQKKRKSVINPTSDDIMIIEEKIIKKGCKKPGCKRAVKRPIKDFIDIADSDGEDSEVLIVESYNPLKKKVKTDKSCVKTDKSSIQDIIYNDEDLDRLYSDKTINNETSHTVKKEILAPLIKQETSSKIKTRATFQPKKEISTPLIKKETSSSIKNKTALQPKKEITSVIKNESSSSLASSSKRQLRPKRVKEEIQKSTTTGGRVRPHENVDGPTCFKCNKVCKDKANLRNHVLSHYYDWFDSVIAKAKPFICSQGCGNIARDKITAIRHVAFTHQKLQEYTGVTPEIMAYKN